MKFLRDIWATLRNLVVGCFWRIVRALMPGRARNADFAFLVHPRGAWDTWKPLPLLGYLPEKATDLWGEVFPAIEIAQMRVEKNPLGGGLCGTLIATSSLPTNMLRSPKKCAVFSLVAGRMAEKQGAPIVGLGAYLPALTQYGKLMVDSRFHSAGYTTGHATTAWIITDFVRDVMDRLDLPGTRVAIVGAAGSTGTAVTRNLIRESITGRITLIDVDRPSKVERLKSLADEIGEHARIATSVDAAREAHIVVVVTTAPGTILESGHLSPGTVVIDDSQPRNTAPEIVAEREDVIVLDVLARVPGLNANFDFDLVPDDPEICFTCLAETIILAAHKWQGHFSIGILEAEKVAQIAEMGRAVGVTRAPYLQFNQPVPESRWDAVRAALKARAKAGEPSREDARA